MVLEISQVSFRRAHAADIEAGLLGHVRCVLNRGLLLDGVAVRRTRAGELRLSFPERRDRHGVVHPLVRPFGCGNREIIERQVFDALRAEGHLP